MVLQRATINARRGFYIRRFNFHWRYNKVQKLHWIFMSNLDKVEQLFKLACTFKLTVPILFYFKTFYKKTACACNVPAAHLPRIHLTIMMTVYFLLLLVFVLSLLLWDQTVAGRTRHRVVRTPQPDFVTCIHNAYLVVYECICDGNVESFVHMSHLSQRCNCNRDRRTRTLSSLAVDGGISSFSGSS